jgi:hypothetical protein
MFDNKFPRSYQKMSRGKVYIGQKQQRGVAGDRAAKRNGALSIDVTSASMNRLGRNGVLASTLSPFRVGPVFDKETGMRAEIFENRWQYGKMWPTANHVHSDGLPTAEWFDFRRKGYKSKTPKRRPLPVKQYGFAASAFYNSRVYNYIDSRKQVYVPEYAALIRDAPAVQEMRAMLAQGKDLLILDNDAPPKTRWPEGRELTQEVWNEMINDPALPFGHGYVVAALVHGGIDIVNEGGKRRKHNDDDDDE